MQQTFKFNNYKTALSEATIEQIGNFAIEAISEEDQFYYYLLVKTYLGTTHIFSYGPIIPDIDSLLDNYYLNYTKLPYNEKKLITFITKWLNDSKKNITIVNDITEAEFINNIKDIQSIVLNIK